METVLEMTEPFFLKIKRENCFQFFVCLICPGNGKRLLLQVAIYHINHPCLDSYCFDMQKSVSETYTTDYHSLVYFSRRQIDFFLMHKIFNPVFWEK